MQKSEKIILKNGKILTFDDKNRVLDPGYVMIENDIIVDCGSINDMDNVSLKNAQVIDLTDRLIMPGLINTHTHTCMSMLRGTAEDVPKGMWLTDRIWPLESQLTSEDYYWSSKLGCLELIRNGVTCIADRGPDMEYVSKAVDESGIRGVLALTINDKLGAAGVDRQLEIIKNWHGSSRVFFGLGPHAPDTCSTMLLKKIKKISQEHALPIFIHLAQSREEIDEINSRGYGGAVEYLYEIGFLGPEVVAAHCIYLDKMEVNMLAETGTWIAHCPSSNIKIEARTSLINDLIDKNANVTIATDAAACNNRMDLFEEMKIAAIVNKLNSSSPTTLPVEQLMKMVTTNAAHAIGLQDKIGSISKGKKADIIAINTNRPHLQPWHNDLAQLIYSVRGCDVTEVLIDGKMLLYDGKFLNNDVKEILDEVKKRVRSHSTR